MPARPCVDGSASLAHRPRGWCLWRSQGRELTASFKSAVGVDKEAGPSGSLDLWHQRGWGGLSVQGSQQRRGALAEVSPGPKLGG